MQSKLNLIITILILSQNALFAQDLEQSVSVDFKNETLESILEDFEHDLNLKFSFLPSAIPLDTVITLKLTNEPLRNVLNDLSFKAGLEYKIVKNHIALFHQTSELKEKEAVPETSSESSVNSNSSTILPETLGEKEQINVDTVPHEIKPSRLTSSSNTDLIISQNSSLTLPYDSVKENHVLHQQKSWSLGLIVAPGLYSLSGDTGENNDFTYKTGINLSTGLSAGFSSGKGWNILIQILYSTKNFDLYYNFRSIDDNDPFIPEKTAYKQAYLDIPVLLNYRIYEIEGWEFFGEIGFIPSFLLNDKDQTYSQDGSESETPEFLLMKIRSRLYSARLGICIEYQIKKNFSLHLSAGWQQYFNGISKEDLPTKLGLFQSSAGVSYLL